jgi:hypothetical protein
LIIFKKEIALSRVISVTSHQATSAFPSLDRLRILLGIIIIIIITIHHHHSLPSLIIIHFSLNFTALAQQQNFPSLNEAYGGRGGWNDNQSVDSSIGIGRKKVSSSSSSSLTLSLT